ncbi:inositol polyphosphate 5-phosphatase Ka isoform X1 [Synchiropus splendidus]|uniref:inositol polyphosphate 5-phosphatase Ka isoform X1 n=1 Tax=Synchiropus splendidus TaxID=270530 RepID=UPI00237E5006|nr:inositol polyphosphate 5-phosphatase Ka isoform X1 [Synchiropus splendidus]
MEDNEDPATGGDKTRDPQEDRFRLHMVTWNVATADPPADLSSLLHLNSPGSPDLYIIGLQEVYSGPVRFVTDTLFDDPWSHLLTSALAPKNYVKVSSIRMQGLLLLIFSKLEHLSFIRDIKETYTRTGVFGYWGNKGGVSIRLSFYGHLLCFLNCHLAAHMQFASERVDEFEHIVETQSFECEKAPRILDHRLVFWFGDLNFRIQDHEMHFVRSCIHNQTYDLLWSKDQLNLMKSEVRVLQEFEEGALNFQPTYKFDVNSNDYDSRTLKTWFALNGKKRKPAWTDRILWRLTPHNRPPLEPEEDEDFPLKVRQDLYTSLMEYSISDHKPVVGLFTLELRKMFHTPLVSLQPEGEWTADIDALLLYKPLQSFQSSPWDWIGLYQVGFSSIRDYITYTWVKDGEVALNDQEIQVYMGKDGIPVRGGECVLGYFSGVHQCIVGVSEPFKVQESKAAVEAALADDFINGWDQRWK